MKWQDHKAQSHYSLDIAGLPIDTGGPVSMEKAKEIMHDGTAHGKPLTPKQRGLFGLIAGGEEPSKKKGYKG